MYAMRYEITLPADYDMEIIRERVRARASALDSFPGLGLKAYLIRERNGSGGVNQYAPFYLWSDVGAMGEFLWGGGGFRGIVESFGRPRVDHWAGVVFLVGPAVGFPPCAATIERRLLPAHTDPEEDVRAAVEHAHRRALLPEVHSTAVAVDPVRWELVEFSLWSSAGAGTHADESYEVLHLSTPHADCLPRRIAERRHGDV